MARSRNRLPFTIIHDRDTLFPLSDDNFDVFESVLCRTLSASARQALQEVFKAYLTARRAEMESQTYGDLFRLVRQIKEAVSVLGGILQPVRANDDAAWQLWRMLNEEMSKNPARIDIDEGGLLHLSGTSGGWRSVTASDAWPPGMYAVALNRDFLKQLAMCLVATVTQVEKKAEIDNGLVRSPRNSATDSFFVDLRKWARANDVRYSEYVGGSEASRFAHFVGAVANVVPADIWEKKRDTTPGAIAAQIRRAREAHRHPRGK